MRRIAALLAALLLLPVTATSTANAIPHKARPVCNLPAYSRMISANGQAMVYEKLDTATQEGGVYGCTYRYKHTYFLGEHQGFSSSGGGGIALETLGGSMVAFFEAVAGPSGAVWKIVVRNLRNGQALHKTPTGPSLPPSPPENGEPARQYVGIGPAQSIVVKSDGAVAWVVETGKVEEFYQVRALDHSGEKLLASESDINPSSLAIAGSTLYWTQGGKPFSATLD
jgi:hypothetical protein